MKECLLYTKQMKKACKVAKGGDQREQSMMYPKSGGVEVG
jgi:hypothetical protein